jgi:NADH-quinone oxidoreductase subunit C
MTTWIDGRTLGERISSAVPGAILDIEPQWVAVERDRLLDVCQFLRHDRELNCHFLNSLTAVDRIVNFEVVYHLSSMSKNHMLTLKTYADHDDPEVPSVTPIWYGARLQELEAYDLMGIRFSGHPGLARIFLWEGFAGWPLRKDFLQIQGGLKPGLPRFPFEFQPGSTTEGMKP